MNKLKLNGIVSIVNKSVAVICGLILPRLMIASFGSQMNGLLSTITQYLSLITFLDLGMGAVIQASMYQPLVDHDMTKLSSVYYYAKSFFNKIGSALIVYIIFLCIILPFSLSTELSVQQLMLLIVILSLNQLFQFFVGIANRLLIISDQKGYFSEVYQTITLLLNLGLTIWLIHLNQSIYTVKLVSSLVFLLPVVLVAIYVKKHYPLSKVQVDPTFKLEQKWYGIGQHIAYTIQESTDLIVLSIFTTLSEVSVYSVYYAVFQGIKTIFNAVTSGVRPYLGQLLHQSESEKLQKAFRKIEVTTIYVSAFVFVCAGHLILPFIKLYTQNINDANYQRLTLGLIMTAAVWLYCLRIPYRSLVFARGDFKQTQMGSYIETAINLIMSLILVQYFGMNGVILGTLLSTLFSFVYYVRYIYKYVLQISYGWLLKQLILVAVIVSASSAVYLWFDYPSDNWMYWVLSGCLLAMITMLMTYFVTRFNKKG